MYKVCQLYFDTCVKMGLKPVKEKNMVGFYFTLGNLKFNFRATHTPHNDAASTSLTCNKLVTNRMLGAAGVPVTKSLAITYAEFKKNKLDLDNIIYPVVIKPNWDTACGYDVTCNIKDKETLYSLLSKRIKRNRCICIEKYEEGLRSYRVLVIHDKVIGIVERIPAHVIGNGEHSIKQLIEIENVKRKALKKRLPLGKMRIMEETEIIFEELKIDKNYIPKLNERIPIRLICNSTYGGTMVGIPLNTICKENIDIAVLAAKALNLRLVGFDVLCEHISVPYTRSRMIFIEANASPDISIHENVIDGVPTKVTYPIIKDLVKQHYIYYIIKRLSGKYFMMLFRFLFVGLVTFLAYYYYVTK